MTRPRILIILKDPNFIKSNLSLGLVVQINIIFVFGVLFRRYALFLFLKVGSLTLFLSANSFILLLKKIKSCRSFFCSLWNFFTYINICGTNSSHCCVSSDTSASKLLFIKNRVLLIMLYSEILYASILISNNLI